MSKLSLDRDQIDLSKKLAEETISPILQQVNRHTTVSIERCVLRLLGVEGTLEEKPKTSQPQGHFPLVNEVIQKIGQVNLARGAGYWFGLAMVHHPRLSPVAVARKIVSGEIDLKKLDPVSIERIDQANQVHLTKSIGKLRAASEQRQKRPPIRSTAQPLRYVIVATGNIREDIWQAQAAAEMGADIIAVIRSTAQSLLDYVPEGETTEGFGGTFATQENFRLMRQALDQTEKKLKRRIGLTNYSSGLCMPEIALIGAMEGIDYLLNDAMYGILFRDINMKRNFIDQHFSRRICALSGIVIQTGEDNYLTTADSHKYWYQVLASHFINQAFAKRAGLQETAVALGHAHEVDPGLEDSLLYEWAQAQLVREVFPRSPIKYMPPTKHKTGDIFFSYLYDGLFNLAGIMTGQSILLLGMHTEAIHNPYVQDRFLSLKSADYIFQAAKSVKDEISFQPNGKIVRRARQVLEESLKLLKKIKIHGLMRAIEEGAFANVKRSVTGGKGLDGVIEKHRDYYTPLVKYLTPRSASDEERFPTRPARPVRGRIGGSSSRGRDGRERGRGSRRPSEIPTVADRETSSLQSNRPSFGEEENLEVEQESITSSVSENQPDREEDQGNRGRGRGRGRGGSGGRGGRPRSGPANRGGGGRGGRSSYPRRPLPTQAAAPSSTTPDAPPILLPERMPQPADEAPAAPSENKAGGSDSEGE